MQSHPTKLTIKVKREQSHAHGSNSLGVPDSKIREQNALSDPTFPGQLDNKRREQNDSNGSTFHGHLESTLQKPVDVTEEDEEDYGSEDEDNESCDDAQKQIVIYDPAANGAGEIEAGPDPIEYQPPPFPRCFQNQTSRVLPSVGAFTVQCASCFKWRLIPTKEKYEEIREHITEQPFVCEIALEWRPGISCDDPPDIMQDNTRLWAIDKPNIAQPPPGWQRLLRIRGEGGTKFADVYYVAPSGKRLRSMVEIQRYLLENQEYMEEGVTMSQFSFQIPRPLNEGYLRKRNVSSAALHDSSNLEMPAYLEPSEVEPLACSRPDENTDLQLGGPGLSAPYFEAPLYEPVLRPAKKGRRTQTKQTHNGYPVYRQHQY